jgi:hypothetical protein
MPQNAPTPWAQLYEALSKLPDVNVSRNRQAFEKLPSGKDTTLIFAGAHLGPDPEKILDNLEYFVGAGGRLVITFLPHERYGPDDTEATPEELREKRSRKSEGESDEEQEEIEHEEVADEEDRDDDEEEFDFGTTSVDISERWGFDYGFEPFSETEELSSIHVNRQGHSETLPDAVRWYSTFYFEDFDPAWKPRYMRGDDPVIMERSLSAGTIVIASDSYLLSNEAQRLDRHPELIAWLIGDNHNIIFDELHLGYAEPAHIMLLVWRYRLHGVVAALVLLALLFIWQNATTLVPRRSVAREDAYYAEEAGRDASSALVNLLRRSIPASRLLSVCYGEWHAARGKNTTANQQNATQLETRMRGVALGDTEGGMSEATTVEKYRAMCEALKERK